MSRGSDNTRRAERARSRRGRIGRTWWSARWTEVLESIGLGDRLHRGRSLARAGRVYSLEISPGEVRAGSGGGGVVALKRIMKHHKGALQDCVAIHTVGTPF